MNWTLDEGNLTINGRKVATPYDRKVKKALEFGGRLYALLDRSAKPYMGDNVICVDSGGNTVWRIEPFTFEDRHNPVTNIWVDGDKLKAYFWIGFEVDVDASTGKWVFANPEARPW